jgi:hypothetical protein
MQPALAALTSLTHTHRHIRLQRRRTLRTALGKPQGQQAVPGVSLIVSWRLSARAALKLTRESRAVLAGHEANGGTLPMV